MNDTARNMGSELISDAALRDLVGYNLKRAFNAVQADLTKTLEPFGLRMITYSALSLIANNPGLRPSQLAEALSVERANMVVYVDNLASAGWVIRSPSIADRRAYALECTPEGHRTYVEAHSAVRTHDQRMLVGLQSAEIVSIKKALASIEAQGRVV